MDRILSGFAIHSVGKGRERKRETHRVHPMGEESHFTVNDVMSCYDNGYSGIVIHKLDLIIHPSNGIHVQVTTRTSIMQPVFIPK